MERRSLLFQLVRRDFEQRFVGSAIGLDLGRDPSTGLLAELDVRLQLCLQQTLPPGECTADYPLFLFAGMLPWLLFSETVQRSASSLLEQANLITKTVFPVRDDAGFGFSVLAGEPLAGAGADGRGSGDLVNQISVFVAAAAGLHAGDRTVRRGLGWIVASLHVFLRDTAQVLSVILTFWFWLTPIFITEQQFPTGAVYAGGQPVAITWCARTGSCCSVPTMRRACTIWRIMTVFGVATFLLGGLFFRHMKRGFADVL